VEAQAALAIKSVLAEDIAQIEPAVQTLLTEFGPSETQEEGGPCLHNSLFRGQASGVDWEYDQSVAN
jgi:hypothetical protein